MGEMAEYYGIEASGYEEFDDQDNRAYRKPLVVNLPSPTKTVWVTKEGQQIKVRDMGDGHLVNTIRLLRRKAPQMMLAAAMSLGAYLDSDPPDGAYDAASQAETELGDMDEEEYLESTIPTYETMLKEAEKRGLTI